MTAHLCFVSDQPVPSLAPLIDPRLAVREVTLVHAPERAAHARWLAAALERHGICALFVPLADGYDLPGLRREMSALAARRPEGVVANITGGTKPMTLAAWETFDRPGDRLYYIDIRRDSLRWLRPEGPEHPIADRMQIETYVVAHGLRINPKHGLRRAMPPAERLAAARRQARTLAEQKSKRDSEGGQWLEELIFAEAAALMAQDRKMQDVARQFVVDDAGGHGERVENEIDVAILRDNTLYLIECKTGQAGRGGAASEAIYKLAQQVHVLGGLRGRGILVSSEILSGPVRARARQLGIGVIDRPALANPRLALAAILTTGKGE